MVGQLYDVDLRLLRIFKAVVEAGGLSPAEVTLNMSVSNISTRLSELEKRLDVRLCNRGRQGFAMTEQGQQVYTATLELMESLEHFRNQLQQTQSQISGELRLMLTDNTLDDHKFPIVKILEQFRQRAPAVYIRLEHGFQTEVEQSVVNGDVHLGITSLTAPLETLECQFLYAEDTFLYCGTKHPLFHRQAAAITAADIEQCDFIDTAAGGHSAVPITGTKQTASAASLESRATLILTGGYVGFLPSHYAQHWIQKGEMKALLPEEMSYQKKMYLLAKKGRTAIPALDLFIRELLATYSSDIAK
ncbi:MAG: LysR family transcriptional regulator [Amphritea sp.]